MDAAELQLAVIARSFRLLRFAFACLPKFQAGYSTVADEPPAKHPHLLFSEFRRYN